jgi:competence protein ComEC
MKRPLGTVALAYLCGLLLGDKFQPPLHVLFSASLALAVCALLSKKLRHVLIWPLIFFTGWTNFAWRTAVVSPNDLRAFQSDAPELATARGVLRETPGEYVRLQNGTEFSNSVALLQVNALRKGATWRPAAGQIVVSTRGTLPAEFFAGQTVEIFGVLAPPPVPIAEGLFDYRTYLRRQEIYFQLKAASSDDWHLLPTNRAPPLADRFRAWARQALALGLPAGDESLRLEQALTLGDKTVLTDDVSEPFVRAATYHIFAVDGLRMAIIFGIFFALFRALSLPRAACGLVLVPLIWFYTALTGWPASAIRATVMLTVIIIGWALRRPSDLINSLFAAALIILLWDPQQLFQAGFQLSFFVVLCIILTLPALDKFAQRLFASDPLLPDELRPRWQKILRPPARFALDILLVSFAAWLGSIPLTAYYFHIVTPVSAPANLLAVPLCALVLISNLACLLVAGWFPAAAELFNHAGWFLMECIRVSSHWFAERPAAFLYVREPRFADVAIYYGALLAVFGGFVFKRKWRGLTAICVLCIAAFYGWRWQEARHTTALTILPLNGGSSVFADAARRTDDLLVDCGDTNSVEWVMKPFLRGQGVNRLPRLALTHGDLQHVGGTGLLCGLFPAKEIVTGTNRFRSPAYRQILRELERTPDHWRTVQGGDEIGAWTVEHPVAADSLSQADDAAMVLRGNFFDTRVLLLSDLGRAGQEALLERAPDMRADIVVACLPNQGEPLSDALLDAIQPRVIIITDSEFPATERASPRLRGRLEARNVPVIYTRTAGAVTIRIKPGQWKLKTMGGFCLNGNNP